jgi:hypothetical protein
MVIHIGSEKTGTSSIQEFLSINREALRAKGILFPSAPGDKNHYPLTLAAADESRIIVRRAQERRGGAERVRRAATELQGKLRSEVADAGLPVVIVSNEHMHAHLRTPEEVGRLKDLLPPAAEYSVVFYIRRQDRFAVSLYSTALKGGSRVKQFAFPQARRGSELDRYDYLASYQLWASVFGEKAMRVRIFDRAEMVAGDLMRDFCDAAGIPWSDGYEVPSTRNPSVDVNGEYVFREYNEIRRGMATPIRPAVEAHVKQLIAARFTTGPRIRPARKDALEFFERFAESNEQLRRLGWPDREKPIFDADFSDYPEEESSGEETVDHALICQTLLRALLDEAGRSVEQSAPKWSRLAARLRGKTREAGG